MKPSIVSSLVFALAAICSSGAETPPPVPLRAANGSVVALWRKEPNPNKPYIAQLFAPGEKPVPLLDDSPADHFHHHGLMFALSVDDTDFWAEKGVKNAGREEVVETTSAPAGDGFTQRLRWLATDGSQLLDESRKVRVRAEGKGADAVHWLDWESSLTPATGRESVRLSGSHYFGLGMRFLSAWANQGEFIWSDPATPPAVGGEKVTPGDWCAVRCTIEGRPVTVLMLAHPANPRSGEWFTMSKPFCYLSATLNLKNEPFTLTKGQSWTLRYSIAVLSTPADHARLARIAAAWKDSNPFATTEKSNPEKP
ncbi:MAG: DUF6807 family protein [Verrucomicrobiota bacterium]